MRKITVILLLFIFVFNWELKSQTNIDSLHTKLFTYIEEVGYDTTAFNLAEKLFYLTIDISPSTASEYGAICHQVAQNISDSILIARSQNLRGLSFMKQKTYFMATGAFFTAYEIYIKYADKEAIAFTLLNIGNSYLEQDLEDIGESKIIEALEIYYAIQDSIGIANAYCSMGKSYFEVDDTKALHYFNMAEKIFETANDKVKMASTYNLKAQAYLNLGQNEAAIDYLMRALNIFSENEMQLKLAETYLIIGDAFYDDQILNNALEYYSSAKTIFEQKQSAEHISEATYKIALVYLKKKEYNNAIKTSLQALEMANLNNNLLLEALSHKIIATSYKELGNKDKALEYSAYYEETIIAYYEEKNSRDFSSFQMNLETQSEKQEIEFLKVKSEKDRLQYAQKQSNRNLFFVITISILVLLYLIFMIFRGRERKKATNSLKRSNSLLKAEIEERKKAEREAQGQEARYKLLFRKTPIGIIQFDEDLIISNANERFTEIFNKPANEVLNKHLNRIFDRNTVQSIHKMINSGEDVLKTTTEIPTAQEVVYISLTIKKYSLWTNDGELSGGIIILEDFTEHKKAERYYKANILSKQKLIKQLPDDLILLNKENNILEIHFPDAPEREIGVATLEDVFSERHANVFKSHLIIANKEKKNTQFFFSDGTDNFLVRIIPTSDTTLIIISHFEAEAQDAGIIIKSNDNTPKTTKEKYLKDLQNEIEQELLPIYQNIQRGLSFIMIKSFAEKIISIGKRHNNNKIKEFGDQLFDYVTSFNVVKVNKQLELFPSLVSEYMGIGTKFIQ